MKIVGNFQEWTVTQSLLAKILGLSAARVNQLIEEEVVVRDESSKSGAVLLIDSLRNYYLSKNSSAADEGSGGGSVNFWKEKGLHERAKRQMAELKLAERRGELYEAVEVERAFTEILTVLRNSLQGIPVKMATQLEGKTREEIFDLLTTEVEENLTELSAGYDGLKLEAKGDADEDGVG